MRTLNVHTTTLSGMSLLCDSSAATSFMLASAAMRNWRVTCRRFGARASARRTRSSAATAARRCQLPSISIAEIVVLYVARLSTHAARSTTIYISSCSNLFSLSNQSMKPMTPLRCNVSVFAKTPCRARSHLCLALSAVLLLLFSGCGRQVFDIQSTEVGVSRPFRSWCPI